MACWHQTPAARIGLRIGGLCLLAAGAALARHLFIAVHASPVHEASPAELAQCMAVLVCLLTGSALTIAGPGLWRRVVVPGRWFPADGNPF